ncbi:Protein NPR-15, partial [Aphelenchoides avenae]
MIFPTESINIAVFVAIVVASTIITVVGAVANLIVIVAVLGDPRLRKVPMNLLLTSLAATDFLVITTSGWQVVPFVLTIPMAAFGAAKDPSFNDIFFPFDWYVSATTLVLSIWTFVAIAVERYYAIIHPLRNHWTSQRSGIVKLIIGMWIVAFVYCLPFGSAVTTCYTADGSHAPQHEWDGCLFRWNRFISWRAYNVAYFVLMYVVPLSESSFLYYRMYRALWPSHAIPPAVSKGMLLVLVRYSTAPSCRFPLELPVPFPFFARLRCLAVLHRAVVQMESLGFWNGNMRQFFNWKYSSRSDQSVGDRQPSPELTRRRTVVKMLIVCVAVFFTCYTPLAFFELIHAITGRVAQWPAEELIFSVMGMQAASSINPFIYTLFSKTFRSRVKDIFHA